MDSHGRGALQPPNAPWRGGESRSRYENPLTERSCRFDPGSGHQPYLFGYGASRSGAGTHQISIGPRRPRNANCGSCRNEVDAELPRVSGETRKAAATVQENNTSPARARLQSRAATFTVSPTKVVNLRFGGPRTPNATSPRCSPMPIAASIDSSDPE